MESYIIDAELLYDTMVNNRQNIPNVLSLMDDYYQLTNIIKCIEHKYNLEPEIWMKLCLGEIGNSLNKTMAIYEIPTKQLLDTMSYIFNKYNIKHVEQVGAGLGLLTCQLNKYCNVECTASDNNDSIKTSYNSNYIHIRKKAISDLTYQLKNNMVKTEAVIMAWSDIETKSNNDEFGQLILYGKLKIILIIHKNQNVHYLGPYLHKILYAGYNIQTLPILQLSCYDYFLKNSLNIKCQGITTILIHNSLDSKMFIDNNNLYIPQLYNVSKLLFQDLYLLNKVPEWTVLHDVEEDFNKIVEILTYSKTIPQWIPNMKLLNFWKKYNIKFPLNIHSTELLEQYYEEVETLNNFTVGTNFPNFVTNKYIAEIYLWVKYSVLPEDTDWKTSEQIMMEKFDSLQQS